MSSLTATAPVVTRPAAARRRYQDEVERLLGEIRGHSDELRARRTAGVRLAALAHEKRELTETRRRLAALVANR